MEYINHINKYADSAAIQAALDEGTLVNPYVAMTSSGTLDFNSLSPSPVPSKGVWILTSDGDLIEGVYISGQSVQYDLYEFGDFSASTAATYTLYSGGRIVTADIIGFQYVVVDDLETDRVLFFEDTDYTVEDVPMIIDSGMSEILTEDYVDVRGGYIYIWKSDGPIHFYIDIKIHSNMDVCPYWEMLAYESYSDCRCNEYQDCTIPIGTWTEGDGTEDDPYTFQITETGRSYWNDTYIGTINSIEYADTTDDVEIVLTPGADYGSWDMKLHQVNGSETIEKTFEEGMDDTWGDSGFVVDSDYASFLSIGWDGSSSFSFYTDVPDGNPLSISTIDPTYHSEEEPGE